MARSKAEERKPSNNGAELSDRDWNWERSDFQFSPSRAADQPDYIGSYAMDAMAMSLHCLNSTTSARQALLRAANLRGDADTVAAVVGQLVGAVYGVGARAELQGGLPMDWVDKVQQWDSGGSIALRAYKLFQMGTGAPAPKSDKSSAKERPNPDPGPTTRRSKRQK